MLPSIPTLDTETVLPYPQRYLVLSDDLLPAHPLGLPQVTQNLPVLLLPWDPWQFPSPWVSVEALFAYGAKLSWASWRRLHIPGGSMRDYSLVRMT